LGAPIVGARIFKDWQTEYNFRQSTDATIFLVQFDDVMEEKFEMFVKKNIRCTKINCICS